MENEDTNIWICPWCRQEIKMESGNLDHLAAHLAHEIFWHMHLEDGVPIRDIVAEILKALDIRLDLRRCIQENRSIE